MKAPFPWFGGKSKIAHLVWSALGDVPNYVEPFFGSGAVLLARPHAPQLETVNDIDGMVSNFWRSVKYSPGDVVEYADWPVNENDLHARHMWLVNQKESLRGKLEGDPDFHDPKIAGWWAWGMACWIGGGFCKGEGPWSVVDGELVRLGDAGQGVKRQRVHLGNAGRGVNRQLVHLGDAGQGVNRQLVHLGNAGRDHRCPKCGDGECGLWHWIHSISERLDRVRVCCGDWSRVTGPTPTFKHGLTGVFLDPPYAAETGRTMAIYAEDSGDVAHDVRKWAIEAGERKDMRIVLCGYTGEHDMPSNWTRYNYSVRGGYENLSSKPTGNRHKECLWLSPHCNHIGGRLFDGD